MLVTGADAEVAPYPFTTREPARAMADVPDPRLGAIADVQDIPKRVPAQVQLVDIAGLAAGAGTGEGLGGAALGQLRQADALLHVVRAFANAEVPHPEERVDPVADARTTWSRASACRSWPRAPPPRPSPVPAPAARPAMSTSCTWAGTRFGMSCASAIASRRGSGTSAIARAGSRVVNG